MPLGRDAVGELQSSRHHQRRIGTHPLVQQRHAIGDDGHLGQRCVGNRLVAQGDGRATEGARVAMGDDQSEILHHAIGMRRHGVHVHAPGGDGDGIRVGQPLTEGSVQVNVLDVVDAVEHEAICVIGVGVGTEQVARAEGIASVNLLGGKVRHNEIQIIDQLHAHRRVARRIGPHERKTQRRRARVGSNIDGLGEALSGGQRTAGDLIITNHRGTGQRAVRSGVGRTRGSRAGNTVGDVHQAPALPVDIRAGVEVILVIRRARAVNQQRLHERRAVGRTKRREILLHQRQRTGHRRGRHAGAAFVTVVWSQYLVQLEELVWLVAQIIGDGHRDGDIKARDVATLVLDRDIPRSRRHRSQRWADGDTVVTHGSARHRRCAPFLHVDWQLRQWIRSGELVWLAGDINLHTVERDENRVHFEFIRVQADQRNPSRLVAVEIRRLHPSARSCGDDERSGGHHIGLEPARFALATTTDIPDAGKGRHLIAAVRRVKPGLEAIAFGILDHRHEVGDATKILQRADRNDVLG